MLNKAIRKVEGQRRNIPYSKEKAKRRGSIRYWKMKIRSFSGHPIDNNELNKIKTICEINDENAGIENTKIRLKEAQDEWKEMKDKGVEFAEKELLDLHPNELTEEILNDSHKKKRIIRNIKYSQKRKQAFQYMTKHIGKGPKRSLIRVHEKDENNNITNTYIGKEEIEKAIIKQNTMHFTKAHRSKAYQDKIYNKLQENNTRDKILAGQLTPEDCDNEEVFEFLSLLKNPQQNNKPPYEPITEDKWIEEVKRSKKASVSSIFSRRTYSVYKCAIGCARMTTILVWFYNVLLKQCYYPVRWINIVEITLEKGKGPVLGKLRNITLIEGDLQMNMRI